MYCCYSSILQICDATIAFPDEFVFTQQIQSPLECTDNAHFGFAVVISGDGRTAAAACPWSDKELGLVAVYGKSGGQWVQQALLNGTDKRENATEGKCLAISSNGNTLASFAAANGEYTQGSIFVYVRNSNGVWHQQAKLDLPDTVPQTFDCVIKITDDGNTIGVLASAPNTHIDLYTRKRKTWSFQAIVNSTTMSDLTNFAFSPDGKLLAIYGTETSKILIEFFELKNGAWSEPTIPTKFEFTGTISTYASALDFTNGVQNMVSLIMEDVGPVVFSYNGSTYEQSFRYFDTWYLYLSSLATDMSGQTLIVGNDMNNRIAVLWRPTTASTNYYYPVQNITSNEITFGQVLDLSGNGRRLIIGASLAANNNGTILFYERPPTNPRCKPSYGIQKATCKRNKKICARQDIQLKWTGQGCKNGKRKVGDGGCQCRGYCGYTCKNACRKDKECKWIEGSCFVKKTGEIGTSVPVCF